ncbi:MAG: phosphatase PAP2 family protein [Marinilabiliales bacterium]|nr:phosphatase PAP2 family protein [Marinilabiliales bacterium]
MGLVQTLADWDKSLFLSLNSHHNHLMDYVMTLFTLTSTWIVFYGVVLVVIIRKYGKKSIPVILSLVLIILLADQISGLIKHSVMRLRPSNDPTVAPLAYIFFEKGGLYGFVSAHAANAFSFATFSALLFRSKRYAFFIFPWALLIASTRVYLGVHYPGDILGGMLLGSLVGFGIFQLLVYLEDKIFPVHPFQRNKLTHRELEAILIAASVVIFFTFSSVYLLQQNNLL